MSVQPRQMVSKRASASMTKFLSSVNFLVMTWALQVWKKN